MKDLRKLLKKKTLTKAPDALDEKSLFFILTRVIREEYGKQGLRNILPLSYRGGKLLLRAGNEHWAGELGLNKANFLKKLNEEIGFAEVSDISVVL